MPSFGVTSSMPPGSSSLSPCISTLVSSNVSSGPETSCAPLPEACVSHLFGPPHLPPPPPLSLSDAAPYSPPPAYPPVFPFGPPLLPSARFPPPPNPSFGPPFLGSYFEGPQSPYPPEPHPSYDRWSDRTIHSSSYGRDHIPKSFSHWPLPTFNSGININGNSNNNPTMGFLKPETLFPPIAPYPPVDTVTNFGPKFSTLSGFPNAAGTPSTPSASITSPLASSHFGAFSPPNLPLDFPHSSGRFPFNPHASTFHPNMDPPPAFAPGTADFMPEPVPSYLSRHGAYQPSSCFQAPDHFHNPSAHALPADTTPRPVTSDSLSSFYFPPQTFHGSSDFLPHTFSSRSDIAPSPIGSSEGAPVLDFFAPFNSPYPPPLPGGLCGPFPSGPPPLYQEPTRNPVGTSGPQRDEDLRDRIVGETGKLMYQHLSPEEWRWKYYEPSFADAVDPSGVFARIRASGYNSFHGIDSTVYSAVPNSSSGFVVTEEGSSSGGSKSESDAEDILERSTAQNQLGPSLKLAASALAEMLASGSNGASVSTSRSMLSQVEANTGTSFTFDGGFQSENSSSGGQAKTERLLEDCCSSSGSAVFREGRDGCGCLGHECGGLTAEGYVSGLNLGSPTRSKRQISDLDTFCDFGGAIGWPLPKAAGQTENSTSLRPMSWVDPVVPQSAKGGAMPSNGQRRVFSKGSAGIMRQSSGTTTGSSKTHEANASSNTTLEDYNVVLTQSSSLSSRPPSGSVMRNVYSRVGVQPSDDPASAIDPFSSTGAGMSGLSLFGPHHELSSAISNELPLDPPHNDQGRGNSTVCGSSPPLSQAYLEQQRSISGTTVPTTETPSGFLANLKWSCPESSSQNEATYMGTGFHSLTASISNLSKVLLSLDSAALTPPDAQTLEETLQSSILRLSECLLLEQSRTNKNPATRFVGSDESSASRQGRAEGPLPDFDTFDRHAETVGSANFSHLKASDVGIIPNASRSGSPSQPSNVNDRRVTGTGLPMEIFDCNWNTFQRTSLSNNDSQSVPKCATNDGGVNHDPRCLSFSHHKGAVGDDIIQFLRENDILERSSLERLIGAEAREASLKVLVDELREELELERVENRGTALLCEKIMQEAEISKGKAAMQGAQKVNSGSKKESSTLDRSCNSEVSEFDGQPKLTRHEKRRPDELGEETDSTAQVNSGEEPFLNEIDEVESRLALLRARSPLTPQPNISNGSFESELGEDIDAVSTREKSPENAILDHSDHGESRLEIRNLLPLCPNPRSALLQTRPTAMHEYSSYDASRDINELVPYLNAMQPSRQDTTLDGVEARLALIHGRPGWDNNDLGVFTETEPCTPALDLESGRGSFPAPSLSGFYEDRVAFADRALKAMNQITSQLLIQSETISDMHTAWSQFSEQANLKKESMTELQQEEAGIQAVEARALMIRSRPDWTDGDASDSETEDFLGGQVYKVPSRTSGGVRYESDQFEMMSEISLVRLLDSDGELSQTVQGKNTANCQILQGAIGDTSSRAESSKLESGNPTPAQDVDDDDSDSWEHVRFDQKDSE